MSHGNETVRPRFVRHPLPAEVRLTPIYQLTCLVCHQRIELDTDGLSGQVYELVRTPTGGRELHDCGPAVKP
jgi:hypothetical protein